MTQSAAQLAIDWGTQLVRHLRGRSALRQKIKDLHLELAKAEADYSDLRDFSLIYAQGVREDIAREQRALDAMDADARYCFRRLNEQPC